MGLYMTQARISPEAFKAMTTSPIDRRTVLSKLLEDAGGRLIGYYFAFGESDIVLIGEAPDDVTMASIVIAVATSGAVTDVKTTVLLSYDQGIEAIRRSAGVAYTPPGS